MKTYRKKHLQPMEPWTLDSNMKWVSVSQKDVENGSPQDGDMIAYNPNLDADRWLIAEKFFNDNYEEND